MTIGEKLIHIQTQTKNTILQLFAQYGVDAHLGTLILDAVKSDLYKIALDSALAMATAPQAEECANEEETEKAS